MMQVWRPGNTDKYIYRTRCYGGGVVQETTSRDDDVCHVMEPCARDSVAPDQSEALTLAHGGSSGQGQLAHCPELHPGC